MRNFAQYASKLGGNFQLSVMITGEKGCYKFMPSSCIVSYSGFFKLG